jgi:hypothetical protein
MFEGASLRENKSPILQQLTTINEKAKDANAPIGPQLSIEDADRYSKLTQRQLAIQLHQMLESAYGRDYKIIGELFTLVGKLYVRGKEPADGDADYKIYSIVCLCSTWQQRTS